MLKRTVSALFGLVFALALMTPAKANAAVVVGVGAAPAYGYVAARPYGYVAPAAYVACGPGYVHRPYFYGRGYRHGARRGYGWRR